MIAQSKWIGPTAPAPTCMSCKSAEKVRLTDGREVYPHRPDLYAKDIWKCDGCGGYVGCHPGTTNPLGTPADLQLRTARSRLHERRFDPLWKNAATSGVYAGTYKNAKAVNDIRRAARTRIYLYLADKLGLTTEQCHIGMFDLDQCRAAWTALQGITYEEIRAWAHARRNAA